MSPVRSVSMVLAVCPALHGCARIIEFFPFMTCDPRPIMLELSPDSRQFVGWVPTFHAIAGCTLTIDVKQRNPTGDDGNPWTPYEEYRYVGEVDYEVVIEPLEPDGRVDRGKLDASRVIVETSPGHTKVTLTLFFPDDRMADGIDEHQMIILLDAMPQP